MAPLGVALVAFAFQVPFFDRWFSAADEGHMLHYADLVANHGGVLYRDAPIYPLPGAFYLLALVFRLGEPSILLARWLVMLEFCLFVALAFQFMRGLVRPPFAALSVLLLLIYRVWAFPHWQIYSYSTTAILVLLVSFLLLIRFIESGSTRALASSGFVFGLGVFCKQDYGGAMLLASTAILALHVRTRPTEGPGFFGLFSRFLAPAAAVGLLAAVHFHWQGTLGNVVYLTVLKPFLALSQGVDYTPFPSFLPIFAQDPSFRDGRFALAYMPSILFTVDLALVWNSKLYLETALFDGALKAFYYGPLFLLVVEAIRLWRRRRRFRGTERLPLMRESALFAVACGYLLVLWNNRPQDYVHLAVLYWPLVCLIVVMLDGLHRRWRKLGPAVLMVLALPLLALSIYSIHLIVDLRDDHSAAVPLDRAGVRVRPFDAEQFVRLVDYVHQETRPDQSLAAIPYYPLLHFLAERRAPHPLSYIVAPLAEYPDRDQQIIDAIEASSTEIVVYNFSQFTELGPVKEYAPELFGYLVDRFVIERVFSYPGPGQQLAALRKVEGPIPGMALQPPRFPDSRLWTEDASGLLHVVPPEDRSEFVRVDTWPFRPVWTVRPTAEGGRTVLAVRLEVPRGALLETAIGVHPEFWFKFDPTWVDFVLEVESGGEVETLFEGRLDPHRRPSDRGWTPVEISLSAYAGKTVWLRLATRAQAPLGETHLMGGWGAPRLISGASRSRQVPH